MPWSVRLCVCWAHRWAMQKRLNRSRCRSGDKTHVSPSPRNIVLDEVVHRRHLANTTEWSVRGGDAGCGQVTCTLAACFFTTRCCICDRRHLTYGVHVYRKKKRVKLYCCWSRRSRRLGWSRRRRWDWRRSWMRLGARCRQTSANWWRAATRTCWTRPSTRLVSRYRIAS